MGRPEEAVEADRRPDDLLAAILADHAEIKELFGQVTNAVSADAKQEAFQQLVRKLAVHETAEQEILRPVTRGLPGGDEVVSDRLEEEGEGEELMAELESMGVEAPEFDEKLRKLQEDVLEHAENEEHHEHPLIDEHVESDDLERLAGFFRVAEKAAPTHPHPHGPKSAAGNVAVGPFVAIADRVRDVVRDTMSSAR